MPAAGRQSGVSERRSRGVGALYALAAGGYVGYFPGAPDFVNEPFRDRFPHGLPPGMPLVARTDE